MSDADIKANIGVSTDVEQATKKTSSAVVSMSKQIEDVGKKFSTAGKDIFLGFFAPMAIFQTALSFIQDSIAKAKQDAQDGLDLIAKGETTFATSEEKKMAAFFKAKKEREKEMSLVEEGKKEIAGQYINTAEGRQLAEKMAAERVSKLSLGAGIDMKALSDSMKGDKQFQKAALDAFLASPEGKAFQPMFGDKNQGFKGPDGFSNVIGVGANPVLEMVTRQTQIQEEILEHLKSQAPQAGRLDLPDFTKQAPLTLMKTGNV